MKCKTKKTRLHPDDKIHNRLLRNGWTFKIVEDVIEMNGCEIPVQRKIYSHETLGENLFLKYANITQKQYERQVKEEFPDMASKYLLEKGWTLTEAGNWFKPHWNAKYNIAENNSTIPSGYRSNLRNAYRLQLKLDSKECNTV